MSRTSRSETRCIRNGGVKGFCPIRPNSVYILACVICSLCFLYLCILPPRPPFSGALLRLRGIVVSRDYERKTLGKATVQCSPALVLVRWSLGKCRLWVMPVWGHGVYGQCRFWDRASYWGWVWKQDARQSNGLVQWEEDAGQSNGSVQPSFIVGQVEIWEVPVLGNASFG